MDPKKQDLTPELKQIYERVMNTQVQKLAPSPPSTTPGTTPPAATSAPVSSPQPPIPNMPAGTPQAAQPPQAPTTPQQGGFLSSVPPRPLTDTQSFAFTGNKVTTQPASQGHPQKGIVEGKKISTPIIALLVVVLITAWGLFWAKFFGLF